MKNFNKDFKGNNTIQVSIIIPVYNSFQLTKNCIDSIKNSNLKTKYEIIIADDGSTDETQNIENYYDNVRLIKTPKNLGFLLNVKNAAQYAKGKYIFLMNNDMIAKPKFLDYLYNTISKNKEIGIVGAMMLNDDGSIQQAGSTVLADGSPIWNCYRYEKINTLITYEIDYSSGCGIMFLKEDWDKLGGFDEIYTPAYYEDTDFCYQVKYILGKKIILQPKAQIYHFHGKTYKEEADKLVIQNRKKFVEKWSSKLCLKRNVQNNNYLNTDSFSIYNEGIHKVINIFGIKLKFKSKKLMKKHRIFYNSYLENIFSVKNDNIHKVISILGIKLKFKSEGLIRRQRYVQKIDYQNDINILNKKFNNLNMLYESLKFEHKKSASTKKSILYIDFQLFQPDTNAGDRASFSYMKTLCNMGYIVYFLPANIIVADRDRYMQLVKDTGAEIIYSPDFSNDDEYVSNWLKENGHNFDYVFINRPDIYKKYSTILNKYVNGAKYIFQGHDIHFLRLMRMQEFEPQKVNQADIDAIKNIELSIWNKMDMTLYFSEKEIEIVKSYYPNANAMSVPLFLYSDFKKINYKAEERENLLFTGGFNHQPNADAMRWFIKDIFPAVLKNNPSIKLNIVGPNCPQDIIDMANENIIIHGYLSDNDLQNLYNQIKIIIAPLRYGAGVKGKIIEAIKNQIPVVTTSIGAEGINFGLLSCADTEAEFANKILNLYNDNEKLAQISNESYSFIKDNFSDSFLNKLMNYIDNN